MQGQYYAITLKKDERKAIVYNGIIEKLSNLFSDMENNEFFPNMQLPSPDYLYDKMGLDIDQYKSYIEYIIYGNRASDTIKPSLAIINPEGIFINATDNIDLYELAKILYKTDKILVKQPMQIENLFKKIKLDLETSSRTLKLKEYTISVSLKAMQQVHGEKNTKEKFKLGIKDDLLKNKKAIDRAIVKLENTKLQISNVCHRVDNTFKANKISEHNIVGAIFSVFSVSNIKWLIYAFYGVSKMLIINLAILLLLLICFMLFPIAFMLSCIGLLDLERRYSQLSQWASINSEQLSANILAEIQ